MTSKESAAEWLTTKQETLRKQHAVLNDARRRLDAIRVQYHRAPAIPLLTDEAAPLSLWQRICRWWRGRKSDNTLRLLHPEQAISIKAAHNDHRRRCRNLVETLTAAETYAEERRLEMEALFENDFDSTDDLRRFDDGPRRRRRRK